MAKIWRAWASGSGTEKVAGSDPKPRAHRFKNKQSLGRNPKKKEAWYNAGHPGPLGGGTVLLQGLEVGVSRLGGGRWGGEEISQPRGKKVQPPLAVVGPGEIDPGWAPIGQLPGFSRQVGR